MPFLPLPLPRVSARTILLLATAVLAALLATYLIVPDLANAGLDRASRNARQQGQDAGRTFFYVAAVVIGAIAVLSRSVKVVGIALVLVMFGGAIVLQPDRLAEAGVDIVTGIFS